MLLLREQYTIALAGHTYNYLTNPTYRRSYDSFVNSSINVAKDAVNDVVDGVMSLFSSDEATTSDDGETRFVVEPDGTTVDISETPEGTYKQPNGNETDILQKRPHTDKPTKENVGQSHTHEVKKNTAPDGTVRSGRTRKKLETNL